MEAAATSYITREDIVNFPFPHKLWIVIHLESCDFLQWNRDGTVILLDLVALEYYLNSSRSIFKIKNRSVFLEHLDEFKFERLNVNPEAEEDILMQYKNEYFQRHRLDLLAKIRKHTYQLIGEIPMNNNNVNKVGSSGGSVDDTPTISDNERVQLANSRVSERMLGDLCFMSHGGLSKIQSIRLRFQTILNFQNQTQLLKEKLKASDDRGTQQHRRGKSDSSAPRSTTIDGLSTVDDNIIELPIDLFENPHDSVLHLENDFRPEYAGYYGNCEKEQITKFFGDYLPMYDDGSMEVKKVIADHGSSNNDLNSKEEFRNIDVRKGILTSTPVVKNYYTNLNFPSGIESSSLNFSSGLEPIFKTEEEQENVNNDDEICKAEQLNIYDDTELSMEEFIKFNDSSNETFANGTEMKHGHLQFNYSENEQESFEPIASINDFPQMPAAVKMEIEEDTMENETNFRNFFSQYRASLNMLYEHH